MKRKDISSHAKVLYSALDLHHNAKTGQCNPKYAVLMEDTGLSKSQVSKAAMELVGSGIICREGTEKQGYNYTSTWFQMRNHMVSNEKPSVSNEKPSLNNIEGKEKEKKKKRTTSACASAREDDADSWSETTASFRTAILAIWDDADPGCEEYPLAFFTRLFQRFGEAPTVAALQRFVDTRGPISNLENPDAYESYLYRVVEGEVERRQEKAANPRSPPSSAAVQPSPPSGKSLQELYLEKRARGNPT